ncbi:MAG: hypothetical protein QW570_07785 [Candidatus Caldarchaeum sp.]
MQKRTWVGFITQVDGADTVVWVRARANHAITRGGVRIIYPAKAGKGFYPGRMDSGLRFSGIRVPRPLSTKEAITWLLTGRLPIFVTVGEILRAKGQYPFNRRERTTTHHKEVRR